MNSISKPYHASEREVRRKIGYMSKSKRKIMKFLKWNKRQNFCDICLWEDSLKL